MNSYRLLQLISLFFLLSNFTNAQVTIGSGEPPVEGALLQLKEDGNKGVNSTRGLM
ncbi:hypothetical protein [Dysgonomonas sp. Marseille-P4361]|uniref:hypothetical protein n=1 Tax=Dysgonomonas sp. Marseille-P4361 TaxID=2161820 RepID=UPI001358D034|nr:hypothetical protein [Dysgonomonas sp. Marseille-P4361]